MLTWLHTGSSAQITTRTSAPLCFANRLTVPTQLSIRLLSIWSVAIVDDHITDEFRKICFWELSCWILTKSRLNIEIPWLPRRKWRECRNRCQVAFLFLFNVAAWILVGGRELFSGRSFLSLSTPSSAVGHMKSLNYLSTSDRMQTGE